MKESQKFTVIDQNKNIVAEFDNAQNMAEYVNKIAVENYKQTELKKEKQAAFAKGCVLTSFIIIILLCFFG